MSANIDYVAKRIWDGYILFIVYYGMVYLLKLFDIIISALLLMWLHAKQCESARPMMINAKRLYTISVLGG